MLNERPRLELSGKCRADQGEVGLNPTMLAVGYRSKQAERPLGRCLGRPGLAGGLDLYASDLIWRRVSEQGDSPHQRLIFVVDGVRCGAGEELLDGQSRWRARSTTDTRAGHRGLC